jgi:hypothetical protein
VGFAEGIDQSLLFDERYLVILLWLFLSGAGWFSIDHLLLSHARL